MTGKPPISILQIFNRYLEYGGEEGSVHRIGESLRSEFSLRTFVGSTEEALALPFGKLRMPLLMQKNPLVLRRLRDLQQQHRFTAWQVHNVFPAVSVATYELAAELGVPVIQYLHNYRFGCVNATYFRDGSPCRDCSPGHFLPGIRHACWRGSRVASLSMAAALNRTWKCGSLANMRGFIAISEAQKQEHVAMGIPAEKIEVAHHFLEVGNEEPSPLPGETGDVLFLGRITEEKGVFLLLEAWSKVGGGSRKLRIAGDGPALPAMKELASRLDLRNVVFEGFVPKERHQELWSGAALFVAPSVWLEPFGMVVLEAWRQGRPVLATNHGSFPELIRDGETGWLANPTPREFTEGLERALSGHASHEAMGLAGLRELEQRFSKERWLERMNQIYRIFLPQHD